MNIIEMAEGEGESMINMCQCFCVCFFQKSCKRRAKLGGFDV